MSEQEQQRPGFFRRVATHLVNRVKAIPYEIYQTITDKVIPHGATEIASGLNTGSPFVMYGPGQEPLEVKDSVHGKKEPAKSYDDHLREYASRGGPEQDQDRGIDR